MVGVIAVAQFSTKRAKAFVAAANVREIVRVLADDTHLLDCLLHLNQCKRECPRWVMLSQTLGQAKLLNGWHPNLAVPHGSHEEVLAVGRVHGAEGVDEGLFADRP